MASRKTLNLIINSATLTIVLAISQLFAIECAREEGTMDFRPYYWTKVVLDQYNMSVESLDMRMTELGKYWENVNKFWEGGPPSFEVNYSDPLTQATYIRYRLPSLAHHQMEIIDQNPALASLFYDKPLLNIVSIGSGPGSDMAGVLNYLLYHHHHHHYDSGDLYASGLRSTPPPLLLRFLLADRLADWSPAITFLENAIKEDEDAAEKKLKNIVRFEKSFYQWDLVTAGNGSRGGEQVALHQLPSVLTGDLFMFSRVLTDILNNNEASLYSTAAVSIRRLFSSAPDGAFFLFLHAAESQVKLKPFFDTVLFPPGDPSHVKVSEYVFRAKSPWNNQSRALLGKYFSDYSSPSLTAGIYVLLVRKNVHNSTLFLHSN